MPLRPKQLRFVAEYLVDMNATQAAIRAGYSKRTAHVIGGENLRKPAIAAELAKRVGKVMNRLDISAERVLQERARLAFFDVRKLLDATGAPKPIHELDDDTAAAIAGLDVVNIGSDDKRVGEVLKIKLADKNASLTALEKHLGLYKDADNGDGVHEIHIHLN